MGATNLVLVAAAALGLALPAAEAQDDGELAIGAAQQHGAPKPWRNVRGFGRVLDLSKFPVVIDEPGLYAIDRNWRIPRAVTAANPELIRITADRVTLDLHGFSISADIGAPPAATVIAITGAGAEIRNGVLSSCCDGAVTVDSTGGASNLHHLSIGSAEPMTFDGPRASITDSIISLTTQIRFAGGANLERNTISCNRSPRCIMLLGDGNQISDNKMSLYQGGGFGIMGNTSVVTRNVIDVTDAADAFESFEVGGDNNVVRDNTVLLGGTVGNASAIYVISGTANTLDGNIAAPSTTREQARAGMAFTADGNFYGDNRMAAQVPFALGGTVQTDWGGNVGY